MTTIAYKDGVIAYDSRLVVENLIFDDEFEKMHSRDDVLFFLSGSTCDNEKFMNAYFEPELIYKNVNVEAIVYDQSSLYRSSIDSNGIFWKSPLRANNYYAIGSGRDFALAFMDSGISAEEAIHATMKRDCFTGGKVRTYQVEKVEKVDLFNPALYENYEKHKRAEREHK